MERDRLFGVFIQLFHGLFHDTPRLQRAEERAAGDPEAHRQAVKEIDRLLYEERRPNPLPYCDRQPLALLEVLDSFLWEQTGGRDDAPSFHHRVNGGHGYWFVRRACVSRPPSIHARHTGHLQSWMRHHWVLPDRCHGIRIEVSPGVDSVRGRCRALLEKEEIRLYVGAFSDGVSVEWDAALLPSYRAEGLTDAATRRAALVARLQEAVNAGADIFVLPELTVTPGLRAEVSAWLDDHADHPFALVLPGSFHELMGEVWRNRADLLDHLGHGVLTHLKLRAAGVRHATGPGGAWREAITTSDTIRLLNTPIGLIATPICLDFCEEGAPFGDLWQTLGVDWALVPSYGGRTSVNAHKRSAEQLSRAHGTRSLVANEHPEGGADAPGFIFGTYEEKAVDAENGFLVKAIDVNKDEL